MSDLTRHYAKACDLTDFADPRLLGVLRDILPERDPATHAERKVWEFAQLAMFLEDAGMLDGRSRVLGIGAGDERILFWLANRVGEVVATDIYGEGDFGAHVGVRAAPPQRVAAAEGTRYPEAQMATVSG